MMRAAKGLTLDGRQVAMIDHIKRKRGRPRKPLQAAPAAISPPQVEVLAVRPKEAARMLSIGHSKLCEMIQTRDLKVVRIGGTTLVPVRAIRALLGEG